MNLEATLLNRHEQKHDQILHIWLTKLNLGRNLTFHLLQRGEKLITLD